MEWLNIKSVPERLSGIKKLPSSKSISNRVLIIRALAEADFSIENLSEADDTTRLLDILNSDHIEIDCGNAGTVMRFLTAFYSVSDKSVILFGSERMHSRPIGILVNALRQLGAEIYYLEKDGYPPLKIHGKKLNGGKLSIDGSVSSQFISALILIAPRLAGTLEIQLKSKVVSVPYIHQTVELMKYFGIDVTFQNQGIIITPGNFVPRSILIESDWSSAAFWYSLAALIPTSDLEFSGLFQNSLQGDSRIAKIMESLGVSTNFIDNHTKIHSAGTKQKERISLQMEDCPDLIPPVATALSTLAVPFEIFGSASLSIKESNRSLALKNELQKLGISLAVSEDSIYFNGHLSEPVPGRIFLKSYNDHRLAMSWAVAAISFPLISIENPYCVNKSYPRFWDDLKAKGFSFEITGN